MSMELMIHGAMKALGIKPEQIAVVVDALDGGLTRIAENQEKLMRQNERIIRGLRAMGYQEEQSDDDNHDGDPGGTGDTNSGGGRDDNAGRSDDTPGNSGSVP